MKTLAIINIKAGGYNDELVRTCINTLKEAKWSVEITYPSNINEAKGLVKSKAYDLLIIGSGDSTIGELSPLIKVPLIILPLGRGNTFYKTIYNNISPIQLFSLLTNCYRIFHTDIGFIKELNRGFVLGFSFGILAQLVKLSELYKKMFKGMMSYTLAFMDLRIRMKRGHIKPFHVHIRSDDSEIYEGEAELLSLGNTAIRGRGSLKLFPLASINDGLLDVIIIPKINDEILDSIASGSHTVRNDVIYSKVKNVEISFNDEEGNLEIDGDYLKGVKRLSVYVIPSSLPLLKPCT